MKTITLTPDASGMVDWPTLSNDKKSVVTIGSFDGMHQGHQAVIRRVAELAEQEQAFSVVVLFDPRPALVHAYAAKHDGQEPPAGTPDTQALTSVDERLRAIDAIGVDYTLIVRYTMHSPRNHTASSLARWSANSACARWCSAPTPPWARTAPET